MRGSWIPGPGALHPQNAPADEFNDQVGVQKWVERGAPEGNKPVRDRIMRGRD